MAGKPIEIYRPVGWRPGSVVNYRCDICKREFQSNIINLKDCPHCTPVVGCDIWKPMDIEDASGKFPVMVKHLIPEWRLIPDYFKGGSPWAAVARDWYINGLGHATWVPKPGIDQEKAFKHVQAIFAVQNVKQEHKIAAIAYLLAQWFESVDYEHGRR